MSEQPTSAEVVLRVDGLAKTFRQPLAERLGGAKPDVHAVRGLSFEVSAGQTLGFLGPNGSGKTTTIKMILGLIASDAGQVTLFGKPGADPSSRALVGYLPEHPYFYDYLKPTEVLDYAGRLFGLDRKTRKQRIPQLLQRVGIAHAADRKLRGFSKGMLQRVGIAQSLIADPQLLIYDEPLSGLDPIGRKELRDLMAELKREGRSILVSSHVLSDIESLCDSVVMLHKGQVRARGTLHDLLRRDRMETEVSVLLPDGEAAASAREMLLAIEGATLVRADDERRLRLVLPASEVPALQAAVVQQGATILELHPRKDTLEELFVREAVGAASDDAAAGPDHKRAEGER